MLNTLIVPVVALLTAQTPQIQETSVFPMISEELSCSVADGCTVVREIIPGFLCELKGPGCPILGFCPGND